MMVSTIDLEMENNISIDSSFLAEKAKDDPAAFGKLYDFYVQAVYRYLARRLGSLHDAEDLTSQTFIAAYEALQRSQYRDYEHFAAWLFGIARHKLTDHYRRNSARQPLDTVEALSTDHDSIGLLIQDEELNRLQALIQGLREDERDLIYLRYVAELSYAEMAELLDKKADAVKKSVYRLLARLKSEME